MERVATWSKALEEADSSNPAMSFVREMQVSGFSVLALIALGLYKASAASMRVTLENGLYFSYFRNHEAELSTLIRNPKYFIRKSDVLEYHSVHTDGFTLRQSKLGVLSDLEAWYSKCSAIVHGQLPGAWTTTSKSLRDTAYNRGVAKQAASAFVDGVDILHRFFLCTVGQYYWVYFSKNMKQRLLRNLPSDKKSVLGLDPA